jgi:protein-S-isoprenylcysteine O-methyltransferase Ste14
MTVVSPSTLSSATLRTRAVSATRLMRSLWWIFWVLLVAGYGLYEYAGLFSLTVARMWFGVLVVGFCAAALWFSKTRAAKCDACDVACTDGAWNYCVGCSASTDLVFDELSRAEYARKANTLFNAYALDRDADTTRQRARRWNRAQWFSLLIFLLGAFGVMPFYFVGPWTQLLATLWYWILFGSTIPFFIFLLLGAIKGLRCVNCAHKFNTQHDATRLSSTLQGQLQRRYCPFCAHPLDSPKSH